MFSCILGFLIFSPTLSGGNRQHIHSIFIEYRFFCHVFYFRSQFHLFLSSENSCNINSVNSIWFNNELMGRLRWTFSKSPLDINSRENGVSLAWVFLNLFFLNFSDFFILFYYILIFLVLFDSISIKFFFVLHFILLVSIFIYQLLFFCSHLTIPFYHFLLLYLILCFLLILRFISGLVFFLLFYYFVQLISFLSSVFFHSFLFLNGLFHTSDCSCNPLHLQEPDQPKKWSTVVRYE